ncbi:MAG: hypothetical protein ACFFCD_09940 [Promethearchaeota archaeon]
MEKEKQIRKIQELDAEIHKLAHQIEDAQLSAYLEEKEANIDKLKDEAYEKMKRFVYAIRGYDKETGVFNLPSNKLE